MLSVPRPTSGSYPDATEECAHGVEINRRFVELIDPTLIDLLVVLTPEEAQTFYGPRGERGAIMIWTGVPR